MDWSCINAYRGSGKIEGIDNDNESVTLKNLKLEHGHRYLILSLVLYLSLTSPNFNILFGDVI